VDVSNRRFSGKTELVAEALTKCRENAHIWVGDLPRQPDFLMEAREPVGTIRDLLR
jgi:hypothetical protein